MSRRRIEINIEQLNKLCALQCTKQEIAHVLDCDEKTILRFCKKHFNLTFNEYHLRKSSIGKVGLRRTQFRLAESSASMAIFLGKQYLGQADKMESRTQVTNTNPFEGLTTEELKKMAEKEG